MNPAIEVWRTPGPFFFDLYKGIDLFSKYNARTIVIGVRIENQKLTL